MTHTRIRAETSISAPTSPSNIEQDPRVNPLRARTIEIQLPQMYPHEVRLLFAVILRIGWTICRVYDDEIVDADPSASSDDIPF